MITQDELHAFLIQKKSCDLFEEIVETKIRRWFIKNAHELTGHDIASIEDIDVYTDQLGLDGPNITGHVQINYEYKDSFGHYNQSSTDIEAERLVDSVI